MTNEKESRAALTRQGLAEREVLQTSAIGRHVFWLVGRGDELTLPSLLEAMRGTAEDPDTEEIEQLTLRAAIERLSDIAPDSGPGS